VDVTIANLDKLDPQGAAERKQIKATLDKLVAEGATVDSTQ